MNTERKLYQWDTGQKLVGCTGLYVDFLIDNEVYRVETAEGMCIIPDELLQTAGKHKVYECMTNNTIRSFAFSVAPRPMPPNYVYTPTEKLTLEGLAQKVDGAVADMIRRAESGEFDGYTPVKGVDYFDGEKGDKGEPFRYDDFTPEQLASLKGEKGDPFTYADFTPEQLETLKGADGYTPVKGVDYFDGAKGAKGDPFTYDDFTQEQLEALKGADGYTPVKGIDYSDGADGKSAYQIAVDNGFIGTESEWLASLRGTDGGGVQPDWNQNDETAQDYVKNRPFYMGDPVEAVLVEESTVSFEGGFSEFQSTFEATVGETYKVSWDGTAYECTCVASNYGLCIGNLSIIGLDSDTGEPFLMMINNGIAIGIVTTDTLASHTFSISGIAQEIVKIPAKYIDKNDSGYIVIHKNSTMTEEEARNYIGTLSKGEAVFISWGSLCIYSISTSTATDSTGASVLCLDLHIPNGEVYRIVQNSEGLFSLGDRKLLKANFPAYKITGEKNPDIGIINNKVNIFPSAVRVGVGTTDTLFSVNANGTKSKNFNVLGNGEAVAPALILYSSTPDSTKKFRITVDDSGTISTTEVT